MCDENKQLQDEELADVSGGAGQIDIKQIQSDALDDDAAKAETNSAERASNILYFPPFI